MEVPVVTARVSLTLAGLLFCCFGLRAWAPEQPIVENYVGRQVPTAMVARNLERGSGVLRPQVDTAPFPNLFLVEPPIYAGVVVAFRGLTGLTREASGRWVSALATTLAAWGLFGMLRRRDGSRAALFAVAAFAVFPVTLRYGRAFQPDAMMLGTLVAGLRCWDEHEEGGRRCWLLLGGALLAAALALKVVACYALLPLAVLIRRPPRSARIVLASLLVAPALCWYGHAALLLHEGSGSRASVDNGRIWLHVLIPSALFRWQTLANVLRGGVLRAFTPLGFVLALAGLHRAGRFWCAWGLSALAALALLAGKLHHEYYWLALAPVAAVGVGRSLARLSGRRPYGAALLGGTLLALCLAQAGTTWQTPPEWGTLDEAARAVRAVVPEDAWVVAPEALLYYADRKGCRLEFAPTAVRRAAGEWGAGPEVDSAPALVEFYRARGARYVAVPGAAGAARAGGPARVALQEAIRRRYNVLIDRPAVLVAGLGE